MKIYRDRKPEGTYYRVVYYLGQETVTDSTSPSSKRPLKKGKRKRASFPAVTWTLAAEWRGPARYARAKDAVKEFDLPLDTVAIRVQRR